MYSVNTSVMVVSFLIHVILSSSLKSLSMLIFSKTVDIEVLTPCFLVISNTIFVIIPLYTYIKI